MCPAWECQVCARAVLRPIVCEGCGAMLYCSVAHANVHKSRLGHREECHRMRDQMKRAHCLAVPCLQYCLESAYPRDTFEPMHGKEACNLLSDLGVHLKWPFGVFCACRTSQQWTPESLAECQEILELLAPCQTVSLPSDWSSYIRDQGLLPGSPAPLAISDPLTLLAWIPTCCSLSWQQHAHGGMTGIHSHMDEAVCLEECSSTQPGSTGMLAIRELIVHVLGADKEMYLRHTFAVILQLLPQLVRLRTNIVGPQVEQLLDGKVEVNLTKDGRRFELCFRRGNFHDVWEAPNDDPTEGYKAVSEQLGSSSHPQLLEIALLCNAGLAAYPSWPPTLEMLHNHNIAMIITDYNEEAAQRGQLVANNSGLRVSDVHLNPFRQPLPLLQTDNLLPSCANAFVFCAA